MPALASTLDRASESFRANSAGGERKSVEAQAGAEVDAGQPLLVMEAMKMEHEIVAPAAGTLAHLHIEEGAQVEAGAVLAVIEEAG